MKDKNLFFCSTKNCETVLNKKEAKGGYVSCNKFVRSSLEEII